MEFNEEKSPCVFCKIIDRELNAIRLYEDEDIIAFSDINPTAPLHFLIVPKRHIEMLTDATINDVTLLGKMMYMAPVLVKEQGFSPGSDGGFRVMLNTGPDGGQEIPHIHLHVLAGPKPWGAQNKKKAKPLSKSNVPEKTDGFSPPDSIQIVSKGSVFINIRNGRLAALGAPGKAGISRWATAGATTVVTLLCDDETDIQEIVQECRAKGLTWIHMPMKGRNSVISPSPEDTSSLDRLSTLCELLERGESIVVHCAAGLHRTGGVCYAVLRMCGSSAADSINLLRQMRSKTCDEILLPIKREDNKTIQHFVDKMLLNMGLLS